MMSWPGQPLPLWLHRARIGRATHAARESWFASAQCNRRTRLCLATAATSRSFPDAELAQRTAAAPTPATQVSRAGATLAYRQFNAVPDEEELLRRRSHNFP